MVEVARGAFPTRFSADGKMVMSFHSFVLRTGRHTIVIDTCCNKSRPGRAQFDKGKANYLAALAALSVKPEEVTPQIVPICRAATNLTYLNASLGRSSDDS
jgi:hypothetical protein